MRNGQLKPGYNIQLGIEAEYIVGLDISSERSDSMAQIPLLKSMDNHLTKRHTNIKRNTTAHKPLNTNIRGIWSA